jgi:vacuolar-type H+-ATPase subunit H
MIRVKMGIPADTSRGARMSQNAEPDRGILGYRRASVAQVIADRDIMLHREQERANAAEELAGQLRSEIESLRRQLGERDEHIAERDEHINELMHSGVGTTSEFVSKEILRVLTTAEESQAQMIDRARTESEATLDDARTRSQEMLESAGAEVEQLRADAEADARRLLDEARQESEELHTQARDGASRISTNAREKAEARIQSAEEHAARMQEQAEARIQSAEEHAAEVQEQSTVVAEQKVREAEARALEVVRDSQLRYAAWRDQVEPRIKQIHWSLREVEDRLEQVPDRIRLAFAPFSGDLQREGEDSSFSDPEDADGLMLDGDEASDGAPSASESDRDDGVATQSENVVSAPQAESEEGDDAAETPDGVTFVPDAEARAS